MGHRHRIIGSEAFDYVDHRLPPAWGSMSSFRSARLKQVYVPLWVWPILAACLGLGAMLTAV